ncbi:MULTISPECIES: FAD-dependent oxidoreductase [unclassified Amycolatopsis]|uniref:FAD-dependent oxidoreductase n=1 Tax=unclassified Amycolatopsis TaxID=2618356 RepID=UPI00106E7F65|nr:MULTISPECIES: FAD-dependent oxidoreductase [unclassified Amycolatopsis]
MERTEVIVAGAGPTGLFLAGELALRGVAVTVLDRLPEPDPTIKAGSVNVASAELLDRRGLLPAAEAAQRRFLASVGTFGPTVEAAKRGGRRFLAAGHFAGFLFDNDLIDQSDPVLAAHRAVSNGLGVPQQEVEQMLGEHCATLGVDLRRGVEVHGVRSADESVTVETSAGELAASWLVAADGGRSVIRKQLGIEFDGTDPEMTGYQAIADFEDATGLRPGWTWTPRGVYAYGPVPGRIFLSRFRQPPEDRDAPVSVEELQEAVRDVTGVPVTITGIQGRATRFTDNARQARHYRQGRVFLAGDAAHVHSPLGGQGLNLGLGDAANLGWKLAATVQGWAPAALLDTYETERHPIGAAVLDWTRAQVALLRGDERTEQLRTIVGGELLRVPAAMNRIVALSSGILQHYDVADDAPAPVGSIAGDVDLTSGSRLADHAHDGSFVLVDRSPDGRFAVTGLADRLTRVADPADEPSLLVRPDGVIVWASSGSDDQKLLDAALARWAGAK